MTYRGTTEFARRLRVAAELIAAHPDLPTPCLWGYGNSGTVNVQWQLMNDDDVKDVQRVTAAAIRRAVGGEWKKKVGNRDTFTLRCTLDGLDLEILADREQVCERVVIGTETVTVPAIEAQPERVEEREVVEWRCDPLLTEVSA